MSPGGEPDSPAQATQIAEYSWAGQNSKTFEACSVQRKTCTRPFDKTPCPSLITSNHENTVYLFRHTHPLPPLTNMSSGQCCAPQQKNHQPPAKLQPLNSLLFFSSSFKEHTPPSFSDSLIQTYLSI